MKPSKLLVWSPLMRANQATLKQRINNLPKDLTPQNPHMGKFKHLRV
jgi:hypothetical protein